MSAQWYKEVPHVIQVVTLWPTGKHLKPHGSPTDCHRKLGICRHVFCNLFEITIGYCNRHHVCCRRWI
uniref:Beta-defensin-like domain-containing protein n=1 Tax=Crocodylus porosus TaxID=8502 RepID=A0A7M4E176_CROPO